VPTLPPFSLQKGPYTASMALAAFPNVFLLRPPFYPSYILYFFIISYSFIPFQHIRHSHVFHVGMALCFFKNPSGWVRNIPKGVFFMPPPRRYDQIIFACVRNFAGYHTSVTLGTNFQ